MQFDAFVDFGVSVGAIDINWILPRNELCHYNDIEAELSIPVLSFGTYLSYTGQSFFFQNSFDRVQSVMNSEIEIDK